MKRERELSKLIIEKIDKAKVDENVKKFIEAILCFERDNWNNDKVRYSETYERYIEGYSRRREGKSEDS